MSHSSGFIHSTDKDPTQRSKRKNASSGENNSESTASGQGKSEDKRVLYHCNYCNKDITGKIRIKCYTCPDFDLCVECFSVGVEVTPHKSSHPYMVMDNLSFPLFCPDWNANDEMLLLEAIEMFGLENWDEVAEHVGTKSTDECKEHYTNVYLNSSNFPLPDTSLVVGKNKKELLAMAKGHNEDKKGFPTTGELNLEEESPFSPSRINIEDMQKGGGPSNHLLSSLNSEAGVRSSRTNARATAANKKPSNVKDPQMSADPQMERSFKRKQPISGTDSPSLVELSGYNPKRQEFNPEYDIGAEQLLVDMEFKDSDTEDERELKLRVLHVYSKRLDEREKRKKFIIERNLLYQNAFGKDLSPEERTICGNYDVFLRFHSKEEHEELLKAVITKHRTCKRIQELKEAKGAGCRTSAEADRYLEQKKKRKSEENARRLKHAIQIDSADLLSGAEKRLCSEIGLSPASYLKMLEVMSIQILNGNITKKSDAYNLFKIEPEKIDRVYDMLIQKGIAQP